MTVYAAGAVCWRLHGDKVRVLVIHRAFRNDVSLPKGKVDPGETLPETAVREVMEETGLPVELGVPLGVTSYTMPNNRDKVVYYWAAEVTPEAYASSSFEPNEEVAGFEWLSLRRAKKVLTYERDVEVLERFQLLVDQGVSRTFAVIALRHAKTIPGGDFDGPDAQRPLTHRGRTEANVIVPTLRAFGPEVVIASTARRCVETVTPFSEATEIRVRTTDLISQDAFEDGTSDVRHVVAKRVRKSKSAILCAHGPVLPEIVREVGLAAGGSRQASLARAGDLPVGGFSVLHLSLEQPGSGIIAIETHLPQLA
ncbi:NUDIX hydrolase [Subtercola boreus]|uniref:DNA mismatch repair protein MutT n=1 Tax=Subtercola boreus TaxID=120213 RepID=A0A3E0WA31_9MICO|nr:NUDIX domain-containing protein [Subtercola boreus]RFA19343.1 DNA mismatch repair protein MutT [Subtercola boreus]RFA19604.1 DNA mismatch repair protein MutT [Subtercola boreus]RFA25969.1 DNA mismatch repair protein MutT [Subtercola boreus]